MRDFAETRDRYFSTSVEHTCLADWRLLISVWLLVITWIFLVLFYFVPTDYARDIFFYSDTFVSTQIVAHGSIPSAPTAEYINSWGKIITRTKLAAFPLLLSVLSMVTDVDINAFYLYIPTFVLSGMVFLIFFRDLEIPPIQRHLLAAAAGVATPATVMYTLSTVGLGRVLLYISVYIIYITFKNIRSQKPHTLLIYLIPLSLCIVTLFYWYPPHYGKIMLFSGLLVISSLHRGQIRAGIVVVFMIGIILLLQILEMSLTVYSHYILLAIAGIGTLSFTLPTGGNTAPLPTSLPPEYNSLLPLVVLFPLAVYGGLVVIHTAWIKVIHHNETSVSPPSQFAIFAVFWGAGIFLFSVIYLASSTAFLIGRPYLFALPVLFLGTGTAVSRISSLDIRLSTGACLLLLTLVLISTGLQAASTGVAIHSYEPGQPAMQEWITEYDPGLIYTDTVRGAPLAANGYFDVIYPETEEHLLAMFYKDNYSVFTTAVEKRDADAVLLSRSMVTEGLFAAYQTNQPMSDSQYQLRISDSSRVYHSGRHSLVIPTNRNASRRGIGRSSSRDKPNFSETPKRFATLFS